MSINLNRTGKHTQKSEANCENGTAKKRPNFEPLRR